MRKGYVHLYWGEGKGKTSAAAGLALRALGHGHRVEVLQLCKDGKSGEIALLRSLGAETLAGKPEPGFASRMSGEERLALRRRQDEMVREAFGRGRKSCEEGVPAVLVLDEVCAAVSMDLLDEALLRREVENRAFGLEVVMTGRNPTLWMREAADYSTRMECAAHPYMLGIAAREGVEY